MKVLIKLNVVLFTLILLLSCFAGPLAPLVLLIAGGLAVVEIVVVVIMKVSIYIAGRAISTMSDPQTYDPDGVFWV